MLQKSAAFPQRKRGLLGWQHPGFAYLPPHKHNPMEMSWNPVRSPNQAAQSPRGREQHRVCGWRKMPSEAMFPVCSQLGGEQRDDPRLFVNPNPVRLDPSSIFMSLTSLILPCICCRSWTLKVFNAKRLCLWCYVAKYVSQSCVSNEGMVALCQVSSLSPEIVII